MAFWRIWITQVFRHEGLDFILPLLMGLTVFGCILTSPSNSPLFWCWLYVSCASTTYCPGLLTLVFLKWRTEDFHFSMKTKVSEELR